MPKKFREMLDKSPGIGPLLLYILPLPLVLVAIHSLLSGRLYPLAVSLASLAGFWIAGWFLQKAHIYAWQARQRKWARSTRFPWRRAAMTLTALSSFTVSALLLEHNLLVAIISGILGFIGVHLRYGTDPQHDPDADVSLVGITTEELVELFEEAEDNLKLIDQSARTIDNPELKTRLSRISQRTREILKIIEQDPKDMRRARKFLRVYLHGARKVATQYALTPHAPDTQLEENFRRVLVTIEEVIGEQKERLLENDILDLDVKIEVLETQLRHEGVI